MKEKDNCFIEAPNIKSVWWRLPELITDQYSNQLSASRFTFFWLGLVTGIIAIYETFSGRCTNITSLIITVLTTSAGVYFASTIKDFRWRKDREKQE